MKTLMTALMILLSVKAAAQTAKPTEQVLASYAFAESHTDEGTTYAVLSYLEGGVIQIEHVLYSWQNGRDGEVLSTSEVVVPQSVNDRILSGIRSLSNAEIEEHTAQVVCMMMPMPGPSRDLKVRRAYDYDSQLFSGSLEVVLTNSGCWDPTRIYPKNDFHTREARTLMNTLEIAVLMGLGN